MHASNKKIIPVALAALALVTASVMLFISSDYSISGKKDALPSEKQTIVQMINNIDRDVQRIKQHNDKVKQSRLTEKGATL